MTAIRTALVIGGGIAGHTAALALHKAGIEATVFEGYASPAEKIGGPIALAANGVDALRVIDADSAVLDNSYPIARQVTRIRGKVIPMPALPDVPPMRIVLRQDLYGALQQLAADRGIMTHYGKRLVRAEDDGSVVIAQFADGSTAVADVIIGADGVHSTVRKLIDPAAPGPNYTGLLGLDGRSEHEAGEADVMSFAFGAKAYYLFWRHPDGGTVWGANLPQPRPISVREARAVPAHEWKDTLLGAYGGDDPGAELIERTDAERLGVSGALYIMPSVPHWSRGRLVITGDAAHAPSNSSGQGASLAIESAIELAMSLRDASSVEAATAAYEARRRPRVERIAKQANKINRTKAPGRLGQIVTASIMPLVMTAIMDPEKAFGPTLRYRIDWNATVQV